MKMTDNKKMIDITMRTWDGSNWSPDWSHDFFDAGGLQHDSASDIYHVDDVDYCVEQARDWENHTGDFSDDMGDERLVCVEELKEEK